ncbi:MAG: DoxX family protein [bacterium]
MQVNKFILSFLQVSVGLFFVFSSISKLISIDQFEIYIYSFNILSYSISTIFARFIIGAELVLGVFLLTGFFTRKILAISLVMMCGFSLFLLYLVYKGDQSNCNCLGEIVTMTPLESLFKNLIIIFFLAFLFFKGYYTWRPLFRKQASFLLLLFGLLFPFVFSLPDFLYMKIYPVENHNYHEGSFHEVVKNDGMDDLSLAEGKKIICFFSTRCRFCKLAAQKLSLFMEKRDSKDKKVVYIFTGSKDYLAEFWSESQSFKFPYKFIEVPVFLKITGGKMPVIFFVENGEIVDTYGYRNLNEHSVIEFLE